MKEKPKPEPVKVIQENISIEHCYKLYPEIWCAKMAYKVNDEPIMVYGDGLTVEEAVENGKKNLQVMVDQVTKVEKDRSER